MSSREIRSTVAAKTNGKVPEEWLPDLELLRRLVERSNKIVDCNPTVVGHKGQEKSLVVATVSSDLRSSDLVRYRPSVDRGFRTFHVRTKRRRLELRKNFLLDLDVAAKNGARLICFNEMAFPRGASQASNRRLLEQIQRVVDNHSLFVAAGTYHHPSTDHNVCPIFVPGGCVDPHAKLTSAARLKEHVRTPSGRIMRYYRTGFGKVGLLICLDAFEPTLFLKMMRQSSLFRSQDEIDLVLVPSFSPYNAKSILESCQDLSYVTGATVVFVNCSERPPAHALFLGGRKLARTSREHGYKRRKPKDPATDRVVLHELSWDRIETQKNLARDRHSPVLRFVMGDNSPIPIEIPLD